MTHSEFKHITESFLDVSKDSTVETQKMIDEPFGDDLISINAHRQNCERMEQELKEPNIIHTFLHNLFNI